MKNAWIPKCVSICLTMYAKQIRLLTNKYNAIEYKISFSFFLANSGTAKTSDMYVRIRRIDTMYVFTLNGLNTLFTQMTNHEMQDD